MNYKSEKCSFIIMKLDIQHFVKEKVVTSFFLIIRSFNSNFSKNYNSYYYGKFLLFQRKKVKGKAQTKTKDEIF